ncbi:alpha/beta fold hydrolase [Cellulomonas sp. Leaf334]|uniref:alpha/beta fold hydrolase n=1 Tax=Cellulomonas sp. Leaf334 TaxID=1736339 RepID=UPI0012E23A21|nr:alpha/beta fold hydrolase [Cellulomonas sp. Leaf334]
MSTPHLVVHERQGHGPAVLALHGMASTADDWADLESQVVGRRFVAPNLPGRGPSRDVVAPPGLLGLAGAVVDAMAERDLGETVVVGHSMGAYLAPLVARSLADRGIPVRSVLLLDGGPAPARSIMTRPAVVAALFGLAALSHRATLSMRATRDAVDCLSRPAHLGLLADLDVPVHLIVATHGANRDKPPLLSDEAIEAGQSLLPRLTWKRLEGTHDSLLTDPLVAETVRRLS